MKIGKIGGTFLQRSLFVLVLNWSVFAALLAGEHDDYVATELMKDYSQMIKQFKAKTNPSEEDKDKLHYLYGDVEKRIKLLSEIRFSGMNSSSLFYSFLKDKLQVWINEIYSQWNIKPDPLYYQKKLLEDEFKLTAVEKNLARDYQRILQKHPLMKKIMQYMAFARSETLGVGMIGELNPDGGRAEDDPGCSKRIQDSALVGLDEVLNELQTKKGSSPILLSDLSQYHRKLLGLAQHQYSRPGEVNSIIFTDGHGKKKHVQEYLKEWEKSLQKRNPSLINAVKAYNEILHLHPYGDSNGRVAEVVRQIILEKAGLPPLLTREKTAYENYFYQEFFGQGNLYEGIIQLAEETKEFLLHWERILDDKSVIVDVKLTGGHVLVKVKRDGAEKIIMTNRTYEVPLSTPLPPVKGATVLSTASVDQAKLRVTLDNWRSFRDVAPKSWAKTQRAGKVKLHYPFYEIPLNSSKKNITVDFSLYYPHRNGGTIWFNNYGKNFHTVLEQ